MTAGQALYRVDAESIDESADSCSSPWAQFERVAFGILRVAGLPAGYVISSGLAGAHYAMVYALAVVSTSALAEAWIFGLVKQPRGNKR